MQLIKKYFPELDQGKLEKLGRLGDLYAQWNEKINVISRRDIENIYERHILHSLSIAKFYDFKTDTKIADVGTGGGFPGVPLSIIFPHVQLTLIDSIAKKLTVIDAISNELNLKNCKTIHQRIEQVPFEFDFIVSRAVTQFPKFVSWTRKKINPHSKHKFKNDIIYLKGGDFSEELEHYAKQVEIHSLSDVFSEEFFETKKIIYLPINKSK